MKWLRCLLSRDFKIDCLFKVWDFIFSGIEEDARAFLESAKSALVEKDDNEDYLMNLDFMCLALLQYSRHTLIDGDYVACLKITMNSRKLDSSSEVIKIADRIRKIIYEGQIRPLKSVLSESKFPMILEKEAELFMQQHQLARLALDDTKSNSAISPHKISQVREEDQEEDDDYISGDRYKSIKTIENFHENYESSSCRRLSENDCSAREFSCEKKNLSDFDHESETQDKGDSAEHMIECSDFDSKKFKIKNTKGKVVFDQATKQRRYLSPFEQFLAEQQELFKKDGLR